MKRNQQTYYILAGILGPRYPDSLLWPGGALCINREQELKRKGKERDWAEGKVEL